MHGTGKISGFLYLLQILKISLCTDEALQDNALPSGLLKKITIIGTVGGGNSDYFNTFKVI
jgi:hypothetical protein